MKVIFYDSNPGKGVGQWFLWLSWAVWATLQSIAPGVKTFGVSSFDDLFEKVTAVGMKTPISVLEYWGHGSPGVVWISGARTGPSQWGTLAGLFIDKGAYIWFRCCSVFQGEVGQRFAKDTANKANVKVAAHTRIIGLFQGGLHVQHVNQPSTWDVNEGVAEDKGKAPYLLWTKGDTVTCLATKLPAWAR